MISQLILKEPVSGAGVEVIGAMWGRRKKSYLARLHSNHRLPLVHTIETPHRGHLAGHPSSSSPFVSRRKQKNAKLLNTYTKKMQ